MLLYIIRRFQIFSQYLPQMSSAGDPVQILLPFFQQYLIECLFGFYHSQLRHHFGIQEIIFKGVISENQHIFRTHSGQPVHILQVPLLIVPAKLASQHGRILAVPVPDHQELIPQIDLVHVFQVGVGLDIRTAVGGNDRDTGEPALRVVHFRIIFLKQQGKAAFILFPLHDKYKVHVHQIARSISEIVQDRADICFLPDIRGTVLPDHYLADLAAVKIGQQVGRMGGKNNLVFPGQPVQDLSGYLLQSGVKEDLRIFDQDNTRQIFFNLRICLQQRKQVNTAHSLAHP